MAGRDKAMNQPVMRPLVSHEAERWIEGTVEPGVYFAFARAVAMERAQAEVVRRLRNNRSTLFWRWSRTIAGSRDFP